MEQEPTQTTQPTTLPQPEIDLQESVDLCFMLDCTGSMQSYINIARNRVEEIIVKVQEEYPKSQVRVGIVAYRDVQDSNRFEIFPFSTSSDQAKQFLSKLMASGGGDTPEDVNGAFQKVLFQMEWQNPVRLLVHIADAPCHGRDFHSADDNHPKGYIEDLDWDKVFQELVEKRLDYLFIKILATTDTMFEKFKNFAEKHGSLENELSFQQEQIPNVSASPSPFTSYGMAAPAYPMSGGLFSMSSEKSSMAPTFGGAAPMLFNAAPTFAMSSMSVKEDEHRIQAEACFVDNITKNIKAGVYKQQQMNARKPDYK